MVKSRGEIQKAYRRRLKEENNEGYLARERARRKRTYIPNDLLSSKSRDARNKKNREYIKLYRQRKKVAAQTVINPVENQDESFNTAVVVRALNRLQFLMHRPLITKIDW
mgnify:FL=1